MFTRHNYYMIFSLGLLLSFCSSETNQSKSMNRTVTNADAQKEGDLKELNNQIRREKFDQVLPQAMKKNKIDMWIHVMRIAIPDAFGAEELGSTSGVFVFVWGLF